jgi:O-antigen ligase
MSRSAASAFRRLNRGLDHATGGTLLFLLVFAPWAFGSTAVWSAWTTTVLAYGVGLLALSRWIAGRLTGFEDPRWDVPGRGSSVLWLLGAGTVVLLAYVALSLFNARARVLWTADGFEFDYREIRSWLPTTYDLDATRKALIRWTGLALAFFGARSWLLGMNRSERHRAEDGRLAREESRIPGRLKALLWTLALSTAVMSVVGILHRLDGDPQLLWLRKTRMIFARDMFGPFPYKANGAQYLNLIWPLVLGFWWILRQETKRTLGPTLRVGGGPHVLLLPCAGLILAGAIVASSRGGVMIAVAELVLAIAILAVAGRNQRGTGWFLGGTSFLALLMGWILAGSYLQTRFATVLSDTSLSGRTQIYAGAEKIAADFPVFGTGAESYMAVSGLYRARPQDDWPAYVHNDWLEARVTLGWSGFLLVLTLLVLVPLCHFRHGVLRLPPEFRALVAVALGGMLLHARFDFPFQILSLHLAFLIVAALATTLAPFAQSPQDPTSTLGNTDPATEPSDSSPRRDRRSGRSRSSAPGS